MGFLFFWGKRPQMWEEKHQKQSFSSFSVVFILKNISKADVFQKNMIFNKATKKQSFLKIDTTCVGLF